MPDDDYSQDSRPLRVKTPLAKDTLLLERVIGAEELSRLYRFELTMLAKADAVVPFDKLLGQPVSVELGDPGKEKPERYIHGMVSEFSQGESVAGDDGRKFHRFTADVVPKAWLLTKTVRSRIFQQMTVPDILRKVFTGFTTDFKIQGEYPARDYCVQYRESDFDFASRLMEEDGIYYFFKHTADEHTLVLADTPQGHPPLADPVKVPFAAAGGKPTESDTGEVVQGWRKRQGLRSGKVTLWDYCFETPEKTDHLEATATPPAQAQAGEISHRRISGVTSKLELYDYPGGYADRFDGITPDGGEQADKLSGIAPEGKRTATVRLQQEMWPGLLIDGQSDVRRFTAGHTFLLSKHGHGDGKYLLARVEHAADITGSYTAAVAVTCIYTNNFVAVPAAVPFRPVSVTHKPQVAGPQTAVVVGPAGQEIHCDKYGRVKVQFRWDRDGKSNESSSCWVRTVTPWAGAMWGMVHVPRIGHEVLVGFEDGDPDKPVILGGVYNAALMPPYKLSDNASQSGLKTHSTPKGTDKNFNELRFEDKKGAEDIYFHAERDFHRVVENNDWLKVGYDTKSDGNQLVHIFNNQAIVVGGGEGEAKDGSLSETVWKNRTTVVKTGNETLTVEKGFRLVDIQTGDETLKVGTGNRLVEIKTGNDTHTVKTGNRLVEINTGNDKLVVMGDRETEIKTGNDKLTVSLGNQTTKVLLGASKTEAMQMIELKVGANSIKIDQTGITLTGIIVKIDGTAVLQTSAPITKLSAAGIMMIKGAITMIN